MLDALLNEERDETPSGQLLMATVAGTPASLTGAGYMLSFPGPNGSSMKRFKSLTPQSKLQAGDLVLVARVSGTYVILGKPELLTYAKWNQL